MPEFLERKLDTEYHFTETEMSVVKNGVVYCKTGYIDATYPDFDWVIDSFDKAPSANVCRYDPYLLKLVIDVVPKCIEFEIEMKKYKTTLTFDGGKALLMGNL